MADKKSNNAGIGFGGALCLLFIGLKLTGFISWSWWWVTSPIWIPCGLAIVIGCVAGITKAIHERKRLAFVVDKLKEDHPDLAPVNKKSKFMQKLDEAMKASESRRNQNIILLIILSSLASCSSPEFCDCDALRETKQKAWDSWQTIVSHNHETDETRLGSEWDEESKAANAVYVSVYNMVKMHCE